MNFDETVGISVNFYSYSVEIHKLWSTYDKMESMKCVLHPLALVSICDRETRLRRGGSKLHSNAPLIGLLFGPTSENNTLNIYDGTEAIYDYDEELDSVVLNLPKIAERKTLWCTVYPTHELLGWFTVGSTVDNWHMKIHNEIVGSLLFHGNPIFLLMNQSPDPSSRVLPLSIFAIDESKRSANTSDFTPLNVSMDALQVEKIALDQIVKSAPTFGKSSLETQNTRMIMSLKTLRAKVDFLITGVSTLKSAGKLDNTLMRMVGKICALLPELEEESISAAFESDLVDCLMTVYVSLAAKNSAALNDLSDKYLSTYGRRGAQF